MLRNNGIRFAVFAFAVLVIMVTGANASNPTPASAWYYPSIPNNFQFNKDLQEGMTDTDIRYLQIVLNADPATRLNTPWGQPGSPGNETTFFGALTRDAAIRFQQKYGISTTGYVGTQTRARLNTLLQEHQQGHNLDVWWPTNNAEVSGTFTTKAVVTNMGDDPTRYMIGVYVEGRPVQQMHNGYESWPHKAASIDVSHLTSRGRDPYSIIYTASDLVGNTISQRTISIYVPQPVREIDIWWPISGSTVSGSVAAKALVSNMELNEYSMTWSVDGRQSGSMANSSGSEYPHKVGTINTSSWLWNGAGPYQLTFTARDSGGSTVDQRTIPLYVPAKQIDVWWPTNNAEVSGVLVTSAVVSNMSDDLTAYNMTVRLNNGSPVTMQNSSRDWPHKEVSLDLSTVASGSHTLTYIATSTSGHTLDQRTLNITVPSDGGGDDPDPCATASARQDSGFWASVLAFFGVKTVQAQECVEPPNIAVIASVDIASTGGTPFVVGQTLEGQFTIKNNGNVGITIDTLLLGGRLNGDETCDNYPGDGCPDFEPIAVTIDPGATYTYHRTFVPQLPGSYSFQVFFEAGGRWYWNLGTENGASNNMTVEVNASPSFKLPLPGEESWLLTTAAGDRGCTQSNPPEPSHTGSNFYSLDFDNISDKKIYKDEEDIPILAAAGGIIVESQTSDPNDPNGYYLVVDHDYDGNIGTGYTTRYLHLKKPPTLSVDTVVSQGDPIGIMGGTGGYAVHLHIGFRHNDYGGENNAALQQIRMEGLLITDYVTECNTETSIPNKYYPSTNN